MHVAWACLWTATAWTSDIHGSMHPWRGPTALHSWYRPGRLLRFQARRPVQPRDAPRATRHCMPQLAVVLAHRPSRPSRQPGTRWPSVHSARQVVNQVGAA